MATTISPIIGETNKLTYAALAVRNGDLDYNTPVELYAGLNLSISSDQSSAERYGYGKRLAVETRRIGTTLEVEFAAKHMNAVAEMMGLTITETGAEVDGDRVRRVRFTDSNLPYLGFVAAAGDNEGRDQAFHAFAPKCIITSDTVTWAVASGGQDPEFGTVSLSLMCIFDEAYRDGEADEVQTINLGGATAGTFTLSYGQSTTGDIDFDATAAEVETALEGLSPIGTGNVTVASGSDYVVTFGGALASKNLSNLVFDGTGLTGATDPGVTETTAGAAGEVVDFISWENEESVAVTLPPTLA